MTYNFCKNLKALFIGIGLLNISLVKAQDTIPKTYVSFQAGTSTPFEYYSDDSNVAPNFTLMYKIFSTAFSFLIERKLSENISIETGFHRAYSGTRFSVEFDPVIIGPATYTYGSTLRTGINHWMIPIRIKNHAKISKRLIFGQFIGFSLRRINSNIFTGTVGDKISNPTQPDYLYGEKQYLTTKSYNLHAGLNLEYRLFKNNYITLDILYNMGFNKIYEWNFDIKYRGHYYHHKVASKGDYAAALLGYKIPLRNLAFWKTKNTTGRVPENLSLSSPGYFAK